MSKQFPPEEPLYDEPPPSYSAAPAALHAASLPSFFSQHLQNLPSQISSAQAARTSIRDQNDSECLSLLVGHVDGFLVDITNMDPLPRLVEMTMVPADAVGRDWTFSEEDALHSVVRVEGNTKISGDRKSAWQSPPQAQGSSSRAFDDWGRMPDDQPASQESCLWWTDGDMARRLANYLQPKRVDRQTVKAHVQQAKEVKKGRWGLFKKPETPPPPPPPPQAPMDNATMTVKAEEVTFRKENEMGIWESKTGYGLLVQVRIRQ